MIAVKTKKLNEDGLFKYLSEISSKHGFIGILSGHLILDYNRDRNELAPLIAEDIVNEEFKQVAAIEAGDFPICSFNYGLHLLKTLKRKHVDSRIILLVNDHKTSFLSANKKQKLLPQLRDQYFSDNKLPNSYLALLKNEMLNPSEVLIRNTLKKKDQDRVTYLFSEKYFRKRFDRYLKGKVLGTEGFFSMEGKSGKSEIFIELENGENYCLSENGACGCSGEIMHFLYSLVCKESIYDFVLFVPFECALGVSNGVYAIMKFLTKSGIKISVRVITGLPCDNHSKMFPDSPVLIEEFESE